MLGAHSSPLGGPYGSTVENTQHALHASLLCGTDCGSVCSLHQSLPPSVGLVLELNERTRGPAAPSSLRYKGSSIYRGQQGFRTHSRYTLRSVTNSRNVVNFSLVQRQQWPCSDQKVLIDSDELCSSDCIHQTKSSDDLLVLGSQMVQPVLHPPRTQPPTPTPSPLPPVPPNAVFLIYTFRIVLFLSSLLLAQQQNQTTLVVFCFVLSIGWVILRTGNLLSTTKKLNPNNKKSSLT